MSDELILDPTIDPSEIVAGNAIDAQQEGIPETPAPSYGIAETKEMLAFITDLAVFAATHKSVNVLTIAQAGYEMLPEAIKAFDNVGDIPKELMDLDNAEREQCISVVAERIARYIAPDNVPDIALKAFEAALHVAQLVAMVKRHVAAGQTPAAAALAEYKPVVPKPEA